MRNKRLIFALIAPILAFAGVSALAGQIAYVIETCTPSATQNSLYSGTFSRSTTNCTAPASDKDR